MKQRYLSEIARNWHTRQAGGQTDGARGIMSACTASALCIEAVLREALRRDAPALIEATANQVNPDGGYTGMNAVRYRDFVHGIAEKVGFPREALILGGDHIGPLPYKALAGEAAMAKAETLVYEYAAAGFSKLHLDTSMALGDDAVHPSDEVIAERAARLARAASAGFAAWKRQAS
ncbi:MAG: class II D-tagatose-bisphosphate aldolase, non-catalytic subunit, partial [Spirochaetaceae bacterium]|nr:class II D-tagatose-bisphosphate aldolase, non-catalytic subunit [Spirochaetaceae bacterium]